LNVDGLPVRTGFSLGGKTPDPTLLKHAVPCAWAMYGGEQTDEAPFSSSSQGGGALVHSVQQMLSSWRVVVYVPYIDDNDLLNVQFPLLESVISAVKTSNTGGPLGGIEAPSGNRWRYIGQKLAIVLNDRLAYEQHYTLDIAL
jgi:hypothetical protein